MAGRWLLLDLEEFLPHVIFDLLGALVFLRVKHFIREASEAFVFKSKIVEKGFEKSPIHLNREVSSRLGSFMPSREHLLN